MTAEEPCGCDFPPGACRDTHCRCWHHGRAQRTFTESQRYYNAGYEAGRRAALEELVFTTSGTQPEPCSSDALLPWWCVQHDSPRPPGWARCQATSKEQS